MITVVPLGFGKHYTQPIRLLNLIYLCLLSLVGFHVFQPPNPCSPPNNASNAFKQAYLCLPSYSMLYLGFPNFKLILY